MLIPQKTSQRISSSALFEVNDDEVNDDEVNDDEVNNEVNDDEFDNQNQLFTSDIFDEFDFDDEFESNNFEEESNNFNQNSSVIALEESVDDFGIESISFTTSNDLPENQDFLVSESSNLGFVDTKLFDPAIFDLDGLGAEPFDSELLNNNQDRSTDENNVDLITGISLNNFSSDIEAQDHLLVYFNEEFYRQQNLDINQAIIQGIFNSGLEHFVLFGITENRISNPFFDRAYYESINADVRDAIARGDFKSGVEHFIKYGFDEGRNPGPGFDSNFYLTQYPDVAQGIQNGAFDSAFHHFWLFGQFEGRMGMTNIG